MNADELWRLFLATGMPEAYSFYRFLLEAEEKQTAAQTEKSA